MEGASILVVEDEPDITELIALYLEREGFNVHTADNGRDAVRLAAELPLDLIVLDIQLDGMDGLEACRRIRESSDVPILFVSCLDDDNDIIHGLELGGDDYITKPFSPRQLVARVNAHLRRHLLASGAGSRRERIAIAGLVIDLAARTVETGGHSVHLSVKEFDLLAWLAQHPNVTFRPDDLYRAVWGVDSNGDTRTLMVHISNLRKKIEPDPANPRYIHTVRGFGYKFHVSEG